MPVFTLMIMNVVAVMYLCVTDVVAGTLVTYSCCPAHGACKRLELFLVCLLQLCGGLSQPYLLTLALTWRGNIQEPSFSLTVILPSPNKGQSYIFCESGPKKSKELKEEQGNRLFSFLPCVMSPLLSRAKPGRLVRTALMPFRPSYIKENQGNKERLNTIHRDVVLPLLCWLSFFNPCERFSEPSVQGSVVRFFPTHTILCAPQACTVIGCVTPQALRGLPLPSSNMELVFAVHSAFQES